jgi:hypothetical protein
LHQQATLELLLYIIKLTGSPVVALLLLFSCRRMLLVQAVSQHRQRRPNDSVVSLANLISAYRAQPEEAKEGGSVGVVQWGEREELKDLYAIFCDKVCVM